MNTTILDPRFNEQLVEDVWRLLAKYRFKPTKDQESISFAVFLLYRTCRAYEGRPE